VAVLRGGFLAGLLLGPPVFCLISQSSSFDCHTQQITFSRQNFKRFEDFLTTVLTIFPSLYAGFDRVNHSKSIFITTENDHAGETLMLAPFFSLAPQCPQFFHSRIDTGGTLLKTSWRR